MPYCRPMLPQFPKTKALLTEHWNESFLAGERERLPDTLHPPSRQIIEGKQSSYQREDRKVVPLELLKHIVEGTVEVSDGKGMAFEKFLATAKKFGRELGDKILKSLFGMIEKATKETGNVVKTSGQFSKADFLKVIDMTEHSFDERGNPTNIFVASPALIDDLLRQQEEWESDEEFQQQVAEIRRQKKEAFDERTARRRLVD